MIIISKIKAFQARRNSKESPNKCRRIREWLYSAVNSRFGLEANWVRKHISECPKCTRRLAAVGRVNLALSTIKTQPHKNDLLMRANSQAIGVLKHSLREAPKAEKLKKALPRPGLFERCGRYGHSLANLAACVVIVLLMKVGVFSSVERFQSEGEKAVKHYYAGQVGEDMANDIFSA